MTARLVRIQAALAAAALLLCAVAAPAADKAAATITATPPMQAAVKPPTAQQQRLRYCTQQARERSVETSHLKAWLADCTKPHSTTTEPAQIRSGR